jgi:hypothetical protein
MGDTTNFHSNCSDESTDKGFPFALTCGRCNNWTKTRFRPWAVGSVSSALDTANNLFGGVFSSAAEVGEHVRSAAWEKAHDEALRQAVQEVKPLFVQCPRYNT